MLGIIFFVQTLRRQGSDHLFDFLACVEFSEARHYFYYLCLYYFSKKETFLCNFFTQGDFWVNVLNFTTKLDRENC